MKFPNNDISFCKMLTWFGISLVFPDEVKDLSTWFGIMPIFPDEVKDLPSWTGQFTYLVLIIS